MCYSIAPSARMTLTRRVPNRRPRAADGRHLWRQKKTQKHMTSWYGTTRRRPGPVRPTSVTPAGLAHRHSLLQQRRAAPVPSPRAAALHGLCGRRGLTAQIRVVALQLGRDRIDGHGLVPARRAEQDIAHLVSGDIRASLAISSRLRPELIHDLADKAAVLPERVAAPRPAACASAASPPSC